MAQTSTPAETTVAFNCGICSKALTDATALLTSCGHFFCAGGKPGCTKLRAGAPAGICEQCGKRCDGGTLADQADGYDARVKSFVFDDVVGHAQKLADILKFRSIHRNILSELAQRQIHLIQQLRSECRALKQSAAAAATECDGLRAENTQLRRDLQAAHQRQPARPANVRPWTPSPDAHARNDRRPPSSKNEITTSGARHRANPPHAFARPARPASPSNRPALADPPKLKPAARRGVHAGLPRVTADQSRPARQSRDWRLDTRFKHRDSAVGGSVMFASDRANGRQNSIRRTSVPISKPQQRSSFVTGLTYAKLSGNGPASGLAWSRWQNRGSSVPRAVAKNNVFRKS